MSETVTVRYLVAGTVVEETHTAERITTQALRGNRSLVNLWRGDKVVRRITYRRAETIDQVIEGGA